MRSIVVIFLIYSTVIHASDFPSLAQNPKIDSKELKCLVCGKSVIELAKAIHQLDPTKKVDVGGHRLDVDGNYRHKEISQSKSEVVISEIIETICEKMDNYVRGLWKANGTLTLLSMLNEDGSMNKDWAYIDIIQDDDLNKSLKYHCEDIMGEHEETIIKYIQEGTTDLYNEFCVDESGLCPKQGKKVEL